MSGIDPRIVKVTLGIKNKLFTYEDLAISVEGKKYGNPNQGECHLAIDNLPKDQVDFILKNSSPFSSPRQNSTIKLEVGRVSYGTSILFQGDIFLLTGGKKPDTTSKIIARTGYFNSGVVISKTSGKNEKLQSIASKVATSNNLSLIFSGTDKNISSYNYVGSSTNEIFNLSKLTDDDVFVDGLQLIVKKKNEPKLLTVFDINKQNGLQVPQITARGVKVKFLFDPRISIGSLIRIASTEYPGINGTYLIYMLNYQITNRQLPFHLTADCTKHG